MGAARSSKPNIKVKQTFLDFNRVYGSSNSGIINEDE